MLGQRLISCASACNSSAGPDVEPMIRIDRAHQLRLALELQDGADEGAPEPVGHYGHVDHRGGQPEQPNRHKGRRRSELPALVEKEHDHARHRGRRQDQADHTQGQLALEPHRPTSPVWNRSSMPRSSWAMVLNASLSRSRSVLLSARGRMKLSGGRPASRHASWCLSRSRAMS